MSDLGALLQRYVDGGTFPGAVGLIAQGDQVEIAAAGRTAVGGVPRREDSIFRIASITKPITAAAVLLLVEDGEITLDDPVGRWRSR